MEWMYAHVEAAFPAENAAGQGARAAETGRLAQQASRGQDREEERLPDLQTSQSTASPPQLLLPPAQYFRTSPDYFLDGVHPLQPLCDLWAAS
jgi:hypothetical protein